jgi:hypothetical protein
MIPNNTPPIEIVIAEDGKTVLIPALADLGDLIEVLGESEFDITPYCG